MIIKNSTSVYANVICHGDTGNDEKAPSTLYKIKTAMEPWHVSISHNIFLS